jgi:hypothetical protein
MSYIINRKLNNTVDSEFNKGTTETVMSEANPKVNERIFLLCDKCLWTVTSLGKKYLEQISDRDFTCPRCKQYQLSSFPITPNDSFTYNYSNNRGIELIFGIKR